MKATVLIVGTGLLGTSLGLALSDASYPVFLRDISPAAVHLAQDLGAGRIAPAGLRPDLVVVATPPDSSGAAIVAALREFPDAVVTDVTSVKGAVERAVLAAVPDDDAARFVGSHPMAGRERSGAAAADKDIFAGRTWVICPSALTRGAAVELAREVAVAAGALPRVMTAAEHDAAVAAVSHLPQVLASLTAAQLSELPAEALTLSGQGLRDTTRIAASDPMMWAPILAANAAAVRPHLQGVYRQLEAVLEALHTAELEGLDADGVMRTLAQTIEDGRAGRARIPGKHGGAPRRYTEVLVVTPDRPGELGRLFAEIGRAGVNIEDVRIEHSAGAKMGITGLFVQPRAAAPLMKHLEELGWKVMLP